MDLIGRYYSKVSSKGRVALPALYRKKIGNSFYIARWYEKCLVLITPEDWSNLMGRLTTGNKYITRSVRDTDRFLLSSLFQMGVDNQGRFVVPKILREYADIYDEVVFLGLGNRIEVWNCRLWKEREKYLTERSEEILEELAKEKNE